MWTLATSQHAKELRYVFVETLQQMMDENASIIALEADLGSASGFTKIGASHPKQFINVGIAEANMIGVAAGLSLRGFIPYVHSFAPFATRRVYDQIFISGAYAHNNIKIYGSDPGVCVGVNGGTHTSFEDIALMRSIPNAMVFDPADATQLAWLIRALEPIHGIHYIRANRKVVRNIYEAGSSFTIGKGNVLKKGSDVLLVSMGEVLSTALDAAYELEKQDIHVEVIDMFTIKPLDIALIQQEVQGKKLVVTLENHNVMNGLGSAVAEVMAEVGSGIALRRIGVEEQFGQVGPVDYLKKAYGFTMEHVVEVITKNIE